jgi:pterin-4a-carbinolamine dehydratase
MEQRTNVQVMAIWEGPVKMNLKPERVQELLLKVPGWRLRADGRGLESHRRFSHPGAASTWAAQACRLAALRNQPVMVKLWKREVVLTLHGYPAHGCVGGLTEKVFDLAALIGA